MVRGKLFTQMMVMSGEARRGGEALLRRRKKGQGKDEGKMAHEKGPLCPFKKANRKGK